MIGNSDYENAPLANPVNDARLIAQTLRQLDFQVLEHLNVNQKDMKRAIQLFGDRLELAGAEAVGLFYYAGHGVAVNGRNYLIPTDAAIDRESDVDIEAVATDTVLAQMEYTKNALNFVILDACRNNPYTRSFRSATRGLARMDAPRGTLISYATAPGDVALDGDGKHSPYSQALAKAMLKPGMQVEQMFKRVRQLVIAETGEPADPMGIVIADRRLLLQGRRPSHASRRRSGQCGRGCLERHRGQHQCGRHRGLHRRLSRERLDPDCAKPLEGDAATQARRLARKRE